MGMFMTGKVRLCQVRSG